jgi:V/A-type H+-transporting ATPase subunit I
LANTISFVRLAAYAMSHAAILMATFAVADAVADLRGVGGVLYVMVVICGNAIALILEGVIVAVQVLRLEYYEFFSKFFPGTGLPFRPFSFLSRDKETH